MRSQGYLSPVAAFLSASHVTPGDLLRAEAIARQQGVSPDQVLIAEGRISADDFYRALARHLGVDFFDNAPPIRHAAITAAGWSAGVAPLEEGADARWLMAPQGSRIEGLLAMRQRGLSLRGEIALTSPARFSQMLQASKARQIAHQASYRLLQKDADLCAFGLRPGRLAPIVGALAVLALLLLAPAFVLLACAILFAGAITLRLVAACVAIDGLEPLAPPLDEADLPVYSVIAPLYREAAVVPKLLGALAALDYPRAKLDVKIVVEPGDEETLTAMAAAEVPPWCELVIAPPGEPRTKPRALNVALPLLRGELVVIYDAEDEPEPDQLRRAAAQFAVAPRATVCLQAHLGIDNIDDSWLALMFGFEYAALFDVIDPGIARMGLPVPLGGTSNHFRVAALRNVYGWDAWNVTEDVDLGLRLARYGYGVATLRSTTWEEAPASLTAWLHQRRRWLKGWMQTLGTHLRTPRRAFAELGALRALASYCLLASSVLGPLFGPGFSLFFLYQAIFGDLLSPHDWSQIAFSTVWCSVAVMGSIAVIFPLVAGALRRDLAARLPALLLVPPYLVLLSIAAWAALVDLLNRPFHWSKTAHGLARSSRRRPAQRAAG